MEESDREIEKRVSDIIAVAVGDLDAITVAVEDGVAYIEGVVESEQKRRAITSTVHKIAGLKRVITCLATEHVLSFRNAGRKQLYISPPVLMHYHRLS